MTPLQRIVRRASRRSLRRVRAIWVFVTKTGRIVASLYPRRNCRLLCEVCGKQVIRYSAKGE